MMRLPRTLSKLAIAAILVTSTAFVLAPLAAEGQRGLRANIFLVQHQIPRSLSERGLLGFARGHNARRLQESTDRPMAERQWKAEMITSFNRPPNDLEFHVLFYDVEDGARRFVQDMSSFVNDRTQKTFLQRVHLDRGRGRHDGFQPNRRMELVATVRRQEVGRLRFELRGEEERRTGEVSFSDDER